MSTKGKDQLTVGSLLFFICWTISLILLPASLYFKFISITNKTFFLAILIQIGLILTPFLKSFSVGNLFKIELKELSKSVDELRSSIQNFINIQHNNIQSIKNYNISTPIGSFSAEMSKISNKYLNLGNSLYNQKRYIESLKYYKKAYDFDKNNWVTSLMLGFLYISLEDLKVPQELWGFNNEERITRSIFYSTQATLLDPNHFNQYMNLGIAYLHFGGENSFKLAYKNLEIAYEMLNNDPNIQLNPIFITNKGKVKSFMGEAAEKLDQIELAIKNRKESIDIFENCPNPKPFEIKKWISLSQDAISCLVKKK